MRSTEEVLRRIAALETREALLPPSGLVLAAVSGGADSMCLLHWLKTVCPERGLRLEALHFNHRLRGEEAQRDQDFVARQCQAWDIPLHLGSGDVSAAARAAGRGIEDMARELRYAFFRQCAAEQNAAAVATAHNADDNGETLLLHLLRGSGLQGLTGMRPRQGLLIRPLLWVPRTAIEGYDRENGVSYVEDSSNRELCYTRNWLRRQVFPLLRTHNPNLTDTLLRTAAVLEGENGLLERLTREQGPEIRREGAICSLSATELAALPRPLGLRTVQRLAESANPQTVLSYAQREALLALAESEKPSGKLSLPQGLEARRRYDRLELGPRRETEKPEPVEALLPCELQWGGRRYRFTEERYQGETQHPWDFAFRQRGVSLTLRPRAAGDRLAPIGRREKSLKKWMIDEKIPRELRDALPVLLQEDEICGVPGLGVSRNVHPEKGEAVWRCRCLNPEHRKNEGMDSHGRPEQRH